MSKSTKLHEVLAVITDKEATAKKVREEATTTFVKKSNHFMGSHRTLEMFNDERKQEEAGAEEIKPLVTTVADKLEYVAESQIEWWDVVLQQEATNQNAVADLILNGETIAEGLPATFYLGLESKLKALRSVFEAIPTLDPSAEWKLNESLGKNIYDTVHALKAQKQEKKKAHQIIVPPTDKHPAQVETWDENVVVGTYTTKITCGMISPAEKSDLLGRTDTLIQAVKQARQRANNTDVVNKQIGKKLFTYLLGK